ncbi:sialate O-acetylesterase [Olivibacter sp. CPCC 100613]|uniref:sialate O-acetylesterase n=1 Tax=Olivibacter sp. CPCC 100613 TaxID=3079931 RepID=UPI002FF9704E
MLRKLLILLVVLSGTHTVRAQEKKTDLSLSPVLQSKMVIQQNKPFKIWGRAKAGESVQISADWLRTTINVQADDSDQFMAILDVPAIEKNDFSEHVIRIRAGADEVLLDSLLIGDVWFCSGQSNMQFSLKEDIHAASDLPKANHPHLRLFSAGLNFSENPIDSISGTWALCTPTKAKDFSAVAYYMGKKLLDSLQYPIGLIFTGIGASAAQAYVPKSVLADDPLLNRRYLQPYLASPKSKEKIDGGFSFEKVTRPYLLYNALIHPFVNLSIKGFTWYQGEANHLERESYTHLTQVMIETWRKIFGQGDLPFYYVQIAPYDHEKKDPNLVFDAFFREAQGKIAELNNTAMITSVDIGESDNLHPRNKKPLGERLAYTALNRNYARLGVPYEGPKMAYVQYEGSKAIVYYEPKSMANGLTTKDGAMPKFFALAGADQIFHPAKAVIQQDHIVLTAEGVDHPKAVRYAFFNDPETNLQNGAGLPAQPFRTDQWAEPKN